MKTYIILFITSLVSMAVIDGVWLSTMAKKFYGSHIGHLMSESPKWGPAIIFYLIYIFGLTYLVLYPSFVNNFTFGKVFLMGAVFGLVAYATYDLTNQATLRDWPTIVTIVDLAWGAVLTGVVSVISIWASRMFV